MRFGQYIRKARKEARMTLKELADELGVQFVYVGEVERGVAKPFEEKHFQNLVAALPVQMSMLRRLAMQDRGELRIELGENSPVAMQRMAEMFPAVSWEKITEKDLEEFFEKYKTREETDE